MRSHERMLSPQIPSGPPDPENDEIYPDIPIVMTVEEAARILQIGRTTIFKIIHDGNIKTFLAGSKLRISRAALIAFMDGPQRDNYDD